MTRSQLCLTARQARAGPAALTRGKARKALVPQPIAISAGLRRLRNS